MGVWLKGKFTPRNPNKYIGDLDKIVYRSSWERTFMAWCDNTPEIVNWDSERTIIPYFDPVKQADRRYFMDFKIRTRQADGSLKIILVEIKPYKQTIKPRFSKAKSDKTMLMEQCAYATNNAKWTAAKALCKANGWGFIILTEKELFGGIDTGYKPKKPAKK